MLNRKCTRAICSNHGGKENKTSRPNTQTKNPFSHTRLWTQPFQRSSPVLMMVLMTPATCPFSMELSSLTMRIRQEQRTSRERASRIRPMARSGRFTFTNRWLPENSLSGIMINRI
uniref:Uncharacterized protein n=1 Tax=Cynoglossus semilaevis TaxID=244447 RepID=A0A3P8VDM4_CYNSE